MGFFRQLGLLLWKNILLQRRKVCVSIFEVLLPVVFAIIILGIRIIVKPTQFSNSTLYNTTTLENEKMYQAFNTVMPLELGYVPNNSLTRDIMTDVLGRILPRQEMGSLFDHGKC